MILESVEELHARSEIWMVNSYLRWFVHVLKFHEFSLEIIFPLGFPAYLTGLQQPMYGYGGVGAGPQLGGVSGQQLEDLAALQRSTLANLPQLVGSGAQGTNSKGVR